MSCRGSPTASQASPRPIPAPDQRLHSLHIARGWMVQRMPPDDGEVTGLLARMLLTDARRPARTNAEGELIPLADQDRKVWNQALIAEGVSLINGAVAKGAVGEYQLGRDGCDCGFDVGRPLLPSPIHSGGARRPWVNVMAGRPPVEHDSVLETVLRCRPFESSRPVRGTASPRSGTPFRTCSRE